MNIGQIKWPSDLKTANLLYLEFLLKLIRSLSIEFDDHKPSPVAVAINYMKGAISEDEYLSAADFWWKLLESTGGDNNPHNKNAIKIRICIFVLSANLKSTEGIEEHLSWFFELIEELGIDLTEPITLMRDFFEFNI